MLWNIWFTSKAKTTKWMVLLMVIIMLLDVTFLFTSEGNPWLRHFNHPWHLAWPPEQRVFSMKTSFQVLTNGFSFWEPHFRSVSRSGPSTENLNSGLLSRILATSVQVLEGCALWSFIMWILSLDLQSILLCWFSIKALDLSLSYYWNHFLIHHAINF